MADPINPVNNNAAGAGLQAATNDITTNIQDMMAFQSTMGKLNKMAGFTSGIAATHEAQGQAAIKRGDAVKQQV